MNQLPNNPNLNRNRVPQVGELATLRATASHMQGVIDHNLHAADVAQEAYEAITVRYNSQLMVLEGIQSELHAAKNAVDGLRRVAVSLEPDLQELHGLLHPIRRYSDDILRLIFEEHAEDTICSFNAAVTLSHVCQHWRRIALSTPTLWKYVILTSKAREDMLKSQVKAFVTRVGKVASTVIININVDDMSTPKAIKCVKKIPFSLLSKTQSLSTVEFHILHESANPSFIFDAIEKFPRGDVDTLLINLDSQMPATFNPDVFIAKFSGLRHLTLEQCAFEVPLSAELSQGLSNVIELTLSEVISVPIWELLQMTRKHLQKLMFIGCSPLASSEPRIDQCVMAELSSICIVEPGFPWHQVQCPKLAHVSLPVSTIGVEGERFWNFLSTTKSITTADINTYDKDSEQLTRLARSTLPLRALQVYSPTNNVIRSVLVQHAGLERPPFPDLLHLSFKDVDEEFKADTLDSLIQRRCFPRGHPESMLDPDVKSSLEKFEIKTDSEAGSMDWMRSRYLARYFTMTTRHLSGGGSTISYLFTGDMVAH